MVWIMKRLVSAWRGMRTSTRRIVNWVFVVGWALVVGAIASAGVAVGSPEEIDGMWVSATVGTDGSAQITEIIDYNFGGRDRHGIFRDVPGLDPQAPVRVESATAPDKLKVFPPVGSDTRIRIGDPFKTVTERHRYRIDFRVLDVASAGHLDYNAVGTEWEVDLNNVEIHLRLPWEVDDVTCHQGSAGAVGGCEATEVEPGHLAVEVDRLAPGEGITVETVPVVAPSGPNGAPMPVLGVLAPEPETPAGLGRDDWALQAGWWAMAGALIAAVPAAWMVRRAGREDIWAGGTGAADAAFGGPTPSPGGPPGRLGAETTAPDPAKIDETDLRELATTEFAPPADLSAPQGGVVLRERVNNDHLVAWLVEQAAAGGFDIEGEGKTLRLERGTGPLHPLLVGVFASRDTVRLGSYDAKFAAAWGKVKDSLVRWQRDSGLWTDEGNKAKGRAIWVGVVLALAGAAGVFGSAVLSGTLAMGALPLIVLAAAMAGVGITLMMRSWELKVRSVKGTGLWLQVESFRRFLAESEADHADWAAEHGVLREYTAWAVAVGEIDHWSSAVDASSVARTQDVGAVYLAHSAGTLSATTSAATVQPSSTGGGGGFSGGGGGGGGVGGGGGGGGGGSW